MIIKRLYSFIKKRKQHKDYLKTQKERSICKYDPENPIQKRRKEFLVNLVCRKIDLKTIEKMLIIGCRDLYEVELFKKQGIKKVEAIDLFACEKQIKIMDMHDLKYPDSAFDLIYSSHSLEHALDYKKAIQEMTRVLKGDGYVVVEVPVNYEIQQYDLHDFKSSDHLIKNEFLKFGNFNTIYKEDVKKGSDGNFSGTDISRIILAVNK